MIHKILKSLTAITIAAALLLCTGCNITNGGLFGGNQSDTSSESGVTLSEITLPADFTDSFNPFFATTIANRYIFPLVYDSLIKLDSHFNPDKIMAKKLYNKDAVVKVTLKDLNFSDGTPVTPYDIEYSLNMAMDSPLYGAQLKNIESIICNSKILQINLNHPDINFLGCLDIPIVKKDTAGSKSDRPIGSGRYTLKTKGSNRTLNYNPEHYEKKVPKFETVTLAPVPDAEAIMTSVKTGQIHAMFSDLRDGETGGLDAATVPVNLNNLIYIGINSKGVLSESNARRAISFALERTTILASGYSSRGTAAYLPINPLFNYGDVTVPAHSPRKADELLDELGYSKTNLNGIRVKDKKPLKITLLYNGDNNYKVLTASAIKSELKSAGIDVKLKQTDNLSALSKKINSGDFDIYLGETRLPPNMDFSAFFEGGVLGKGIKNKDELMSAYSIYLEGGGVSKFSKRFFKEMPFIPLLFRSGIVAYSGSISTKLISTPSDIYYNILDWK